MAAGKPVVAFRAGGLTETVLEGVTGVFFDEPTADSMADAIQRLERGAFSPERIRAHALTFDTAVFDRRWRELFEAHGVDPALYAAEPGVAETTAASG
jgi:glycosyltransferase involved in cell wall biosynthesis